MKAYALDPLSPVILVNVAGYYEYIGDQEKAEELHKRAIELEPSFPSGYKTLAALYVRQEKFGAALEMADEYASRCPDSFYDPYRLRGHILRYAGRYDEALGQLEKAIALAPERPHPYAYYAYCLWDLQKWSKAKEYLELALERGPNEAYLHQNYGRLIGSQFGEHRKSIEHLNRAIELNPRYLEAYSDLAEMHNLLGNIDSALWAVDKAIEFAPNNDDLADLMVMKATVYEYFGKFDSAIPIYRDVLKLKPDMYASNWSLAALYTVNRQYRLADSIFEDLKSQPDSTTRGDARLSQVATLTHQGKFQQALVQFQSGIEKDREELGPFSWPMLSKFYKRGRIYLDYLGNPKAAIDEFKAAQEVNLGLVASQYWTAILIGFQAQALAEMGQIDEAYNLLQSCYKGLDTTDSQGLTKYYAGLARLLRIEGKHDSAIVLSENDVKSAASGGQFGILKTLGMSYLEAGRADDAVETLEKAMSRYDVNRLTYPARSVITHYSLGQAYEAAGRNAEAIEQYETFLDIWKNSDEGLESVEDAKQRLAKLKESL